MRPKTIHGTGKSGKSRAPKEDQVLETYLSPNRTFVDLPELINEMDPLRDLSEACRRELQSSHAR